MNRRQRTGGDRAGSLFRAYIGGNAVINGFLSLYEPRSLMYLVAATEEGSVLIYSLAVVGLAALVDAVINDFMPVRFHWRIAVRQRHFILAALAFCYVAQLYVAVFHLRSTGLLIHYLWNVFAIMAVAFFDAHQRSKDATCVILCN